MSEKEVSSKVSQKSIERKIRKLFLYGKTHKGPRKRKPKRKNLSNSSQIKAEVAAIDKISQFSLDIDASSSSAKALSMNNKPPGEPVTENSKMFKMQRPYEMPSSMNDNQFEGSGELVSLKYKEDSSDINEIDMEKLVQNLVGLIPEERALQNIKHVSKVIGEDYNITCPFSIAGCTTTIAKSHLESHLKKCRFRVTDNPTVFSNLVGYNPLDYVVACPYRMIGCDTSCKRSLLPEHLVECAFRVVDRVDHQTENETEEYEIVCPNAIMGCQAVYLRSKLQIHLQICEFNPMSREAEERERNENKKIVLEAEERERQRRVRYQEVKQETKLLLPSVEEKAIFNEALKAIEATKRLHSKFATTSGHEHVHRIVRAAEIEILRRKVVREAINNKRSNELNYANRMASQIKPQNEIVNGINELKDICISATGKVKEILPRLKNELLAVCQSCFAGMVINLDLYGSYATGLALPGVSDIDFVLSISSKVSKCRLNNKETMLQKNQLVIMNSFRCEILGRQLEKIKNFHKVKAIYTASVPVIKFLFEGEIAVDITFDTPTHNGLRVVQFIKKMKPHYPELYPIVCFLKFLLYKNGLLDPFTGGISSYALVLLVFASLGRSYNVRKEKSGLEVLLLDVLKTISLDFQPSGNMIGHYWLDEIPGQIPCVVFITARTPTLENEDLCVILDPFDDKNNVARSSFRFDKVQSIFHSVYKRLNDLAAQEPSTKVHDSTPTYATPEILKNNITLLKYF